MDDLFSLLNAKFDTKNNKKIKYVKYNLYIANLIEMLILII